MFYSPYFQITLASGYVGCADAPFKKMVTRRVLRAWQKSSRRSFITWYPIISPPMDG